MYPAQSPEEINQPTSLSSNASHRGRVGGGALADPNPTLSWVIGGPASIRSEPAPGAYGWLAWLHWTYSQVSLPVLTTQRRDCFTTSKDVPACAAASEHPAPPSVHLAGTLHRHREPMHAWGRVGAVERPLPKPQLNPSRAHRRRRWETITSIGSESTVHSAPSVPHVDTQPILRWGYHQPYLYTQPH